jgi:hypothetical protein
MKKFLKIITIGCLGIFSLFAIFLFIVIYPVIFPDTPEEIERKKTEQKTASIKKIEQKNIDDYITKFSIKPNHKNSKFDSLITAFNNQKDRFKFNKCDFSYNNKSFFLADEIDKVTSVLGEPDKFYKTVTYRYPKGVIKIFDRSFTKREHIMGKGYIYEKRIDLSIYEYPDSTKYGNRIIDKELNESIPAIKELKELRKKELNKLQKKYNDSLIEVSDEIQLTYKAFRITPIFHRPKNSVKYLLTDLNIELTPYIHAGDPDVPYKIIMFRGIPYKTYTDMYDFLDLSSLTREDLDYHRIYIYEKECSQSSNSIVSTHVESKPYFETSGGGHLTWTGPYNPNKSRSIDYINFSINSLDDLKRNEIKKAGLLD